MIGQTVSHYEVLEKLGEGGMGVVYKAQDLKLNRLVALKFLPPTLLASEDDRRRFIHEAQTSAALVHPNIATVFEIDEADGKPFIALEYIEGQDLTQRLKTGPLKLEEALTIAIQAAEGLQAAHEGGIVHRDVKSQNIMVTPKGQVKILDFGLAKLRGASVLTKAGTTLGTAAYMSPEQTQGEQIDHRSDIWSLGVVLYEMIAGRKPFQGEYEQALMYQIVSAEPEPLTGLRTGVPVELERIVRKAMQKDPAKRYQHLVEMATDLRVLQSAPLPAFSRIIKEPRSITRLSRASIIGISAVAVILLAVVGFFLFKPTSDKITSIAVLPLDNFSHDPDQDYFADGMTETLIADLSKINALKVISRTSVMQYKGTRKLIPQIGRELNVDAILEGSVEKVKDRVRITTQLIRAATDKHLWANSYERNLSDVLDMQDEVARTVASEIQVALTPQEQSRLSVSKPVNPVAHDAYLKGVYYLNRGDESSLEMATAYFQAAIAADSTFAPAYAGLAYYYIYLSDLFKPPIETMPKAKAAAINALRLDESLADAHAAIGVVDQEYSWEWKEAEEELKRALSLDQNSAGAHDSYALLLSSLGENDIALKEIEKAIALDPLSETIQSDFLWIHFVTRDFDGAIEAGKHFINVDSTNWLALWTLGMVLEKSGRNNQAVAVLRRSEEVSHSPMVLATLGSAYAAGGKTAQARTILKRLLEIQKHKFVCPYETAILYLELGNRDEAARWIEKGYETRSICMEVIKVDPRVDALRNDPRFRRIETLVMGNGKDSP